MLPAKSLLTKMLFRDCQERLMHEGALAFIRLEYRINGWNIEGKTVHTSV